MPTLAEYLKPVKRVRKCPHCKSNKGFELTYGIVGSGMVKMDFKGRTMDAERHVYDDMPRDVSCLNCGKLINIEAVKID